MDKLLTVVRTEISFFLLHLKKIWYLIFFSTQGKWKSKGHPAVTVILSLSTRMAMVCYGQSLLYKDLWQKWHVYLKYWRLLNFFPGPLANVHNASTACCNMFLCTCCILFDGFLLSFHVWNKCEIPVLLSKEERAGKKFLAENIYFIP